MTEPQKQKTIGQMLFMAGIAGAIPILAFSAQYGDLRSDVDHLQEHEKNFPHPPEHYKALQNQRHQWLERDLKELERKYHEHLKGHQ